MQRGVPAAVAFGRAGWLPPPHQKLRGVPAAVAFGRAGWLPPPHYKLQLLIGALCHRCVTARTNRGYIRYKVNGR